MKAFTKIALGAALVLMAGGSVMAQSFEEDPRYGNSPEERRTNVGKLNFLQDEYNAKNWDAAAAYVHDLMNDAPAASQNIYVWGATVYKNKVTRATSVAEKKALVDSVMLIYDRRIQHFGDHPTRGTAYILGLKAQDYLILNQTDRAGIRKVYKEALDAAGSAAQPSLVLTYFQQLVTDYKSVDITPEELLASYEELTPLLANATQEEKDQFTGLFATSGAADCGVLEELYTKELAAKPGDKDVLMKAWNLMSLAGCDSDFYVSVGEQYYAIEPSSAVAVRLAMIFEKREQFDRAIPYLNEQLATETDPVEKSNLYVRIAASESGQKRFSGAAQAARQAIALNSGNGYAHFLLANAYIGGASGCSDAFQRQAVYWLAYDEFARAREAFAGDAAMTETVSGSMASCRGNFPSTEDIFMYGFQIGAGYSVSCGWVSGGTTVRAR